MLARFRVYIHVLFYLNSLNFLMSCARAALIKGYYLAAALPVTTMCRNDALATVASGTAHVYFTPQDAHLTIENRPGPMAAAGASA